MHRALVLSADRREHAVRADEGVYGQQPEVRWGVDHDLVVVVDNRLQCVVQEPFAAELSDEAHLYASELAGGGDHVDAVDSSHDRVRGARSSGEHVDQVHPERPGLEPELTSQRELRVRIDDEHPAAALREQRRDVRCRCRLPDAALLVCHDCDHHETSLWLM